MTKARCEGEAPGSFDHPSPQPSSRGLPAFAEMIELTESHDHARLPYPHLRRASFERRRLDRPLVRLDPPQARPWRRAVRRPARSLRPDPGGVRRGQRGAEDPRQPARRIGRDDHRRGRDARGRGGESQARDRRDRGRRQGGRGPVLGRRTADAGRRRGRLSRGYPAQVPLPRPAPRAAARQHHASLEGHRLDPPAHDRPGLHRVPDADPDRFVARRRARLSGAEPGPSGQILRASAGAADVQAAADGRRLRPLFPDRALLPRRGRARRPLARANSTSSTSK